MISRFLCGAIVLAILSVAPTPARADFKAEQIRRGKRATALVVLPTGKGFGTAFCIDTAGVFVTSAHVVKTATAGTVSLVLNSADADEKKVVAEVLRVDKKADLALLYVKDADKLKLTSLEMGKAADLIETQQVVAFGYPFGKSLAVKEKKYPSISVNVGRITALRKAKGQLQTIQLDAQLNPGNSGGPVLDESGKVVGIVRSGVLASGVNFAIPVSHLRAFVERPDIICESQVVPYAKRRDEMELLIRLVRFAGSDGVLKVRVKVSSARGDHREFEAQPAGKNEYRVRFAPLPKRTKADVVPVVIHFDDGSMQCNTTDQKIKLDDVEFSLFQISRIERTDKGYKLLLKSGKRHSGKVLHAAPLRADFGSTHVDVDLARAKSIVVYQPLAPSDKVTFTILVEQDGKPLNNLTREIRIEGAAAVASVAASPRHPNGPFPAIVTGRPGDKKITLKLPQTYSTFDVGGYGRYLVMFLKESSRIVIVDVVQAKIVHEIPGVSQDVRIAAGAEKFVLVLPGQKLMQRWSFKTMEREKVALLPGKGTTKRVLLGENSRGPMLLGAEDAHLIDLETMKPIEVEGHLHGGSGRYGLSFLGSANGNAYGMIGTSGSPATYHLMRIDGKRIATGKFSSTSYRVRWAWPNADGSLVFLAFGEVYSSNYQRVPATWLDKTLLVPSVDPAFFLSVDFIDSRNGRPTADVRICTNADRRIVHTVTNIDEMGIKGDRSSYHTVYGRNERARRRFGYLPWAKTLITLPYDNQSVVVRRIDLIATLEASGRDYLYVDSVPPQRAEKGRTLTYQINVRSKHGGLKFKLEDGPKNASVSSAGQVTWNVPEATAKDTFAIIVSITDRAGNDLLHSFEVKAVERQAVTGTKVSGR